MSSIDDLFRRDPESWIDSLPDYQKTLVQELLKQSDSPEEAASKWLTASPRNTFPLGAAQGSSKLYLDKLWNELEAFLCGDSRYEEDRKKLLAELKPGHAYLVGVISVTIAPVLGASATFLAPVIALLLITVSKLGLNAWCQMRKEQAADNAST